MRHSTTTLQQIAALYDEERALLNPDPDDWRTEDVRDIASGIRRRLERMWDQRRAEIVFSVSGPPRSMGGGTERDQQRAIAHGIQPLPSGGD